MVTGPTAATSFDTQHEDMIHDLQVDYYGKRLATCSSDRIIKIFEMGPEAGQQTHSANITGHEGPVWQVAWAHPKFGSILASCSYDRKVCVWKEFQPHQWSKVYEYARHTSSVNAISFAPHELGLKLACASADGSLSILTWRGSQDNDWDERPLQAAHQIGCNAVSWAHSPLPAPGQGAAAGAGGQAALASGGCDGVVRVWRLAESGDIKADEAFDRAYREASHSGWVRDVAWAPSIGLPGQYLATCGEDKTVVVWTLSPHGAWVHKRLPPFEAPVWRLSWSVSGQVLAVSAGDGKVTLWKEGLDGEWRLVEALADPA